MLSGPVNQDSPQILVVDDEKDMPDLVQMKFRRQIRNKELRFLFAENGHVALNMLHEHPDISVVLADINMPVMNGVDFLKARQAFLSGHGIRVIVMTSSEDEKDKESIRLFDFIEDYVVKPVFESALKKYLES